MTPDLTHAVLFVCTFNRVRSPMAAGLMRSLYGDTIQAYSCGLQPEGDVDPMAAAVMADIGIDLLGHQPKRLADMIGEGRFDVVVALSEDAWREVQAIADDKVDTLCWPTPDPTEGEGSREMRLEVYRMVRRTLQSRILELFGAPQARIGAR